MSARRSGVLWVHVDVIGGMYLVSHSACRQLDRTVGDPSALAVQRYVMLPLAAAFASISRQTLTDLFSNLQHTRLMAYETQLGSSSARRVPAVTAMTCPSQ